jgi:hypothetical protein
MAFKMKGSPHKMGVIEGTSSHSSALKQVETEKSPLEQKRIKEGLKRIGKFLKGGKTDEYGRSSNTVIPRVVDAVKKKADEYKPKSETTVSKEVTKGPTHKKGTDKEFSEDKVKVTASTKTNKKKLFGGNKETTSSTSRTHDQDTYKDGGVDRYHYNEGSDRGVTTTTHTRNKRRGGGKKKVVTVDEKTGKKTVTRYKKDGSVKSTKVKKGDHSTRGYTPKSHKKALRKASHDE